MAYKPKVDWELRSLLQKKQPPDFRLPEKKTKHLCWWTAKKRCRICGENELAQWLEKELFGKECAEYDAK